MNSFSILTIEQSIAIKSINIDITFGKIFLIHDQ